MTHFLNTSVCDKISMDSLDDFSTLRRRIAEMERANDEEIQAMTQTIDTHSVEIDGLYDRIARLEEIIEQLKNEKDSQR